MAERTSKVAPWTKNESGLESPGYRLLAFSSANGSLPPSSRKGEALSGIVTRWSARLYAIPARPSLRRNDELRSEQRPLPVGRIGGVCLATNG
jgi:hypothetical protein